MFDKINVSQIISDHIKTLRNDATQKVGIGDYVLFLAVPLSAAIACLFLNIQLKENIITLLIAAFSIFAGLLINVLVLIYTVALRTQDKPSRAVDAELETNFLKQIFANVSFSILISVLTVFILAICSVLPEYLNVIATALSSFLILQFTFTFLMSLKRLHILLGHKLRG